MIAALICVVALAAVYEWRHTRTQDRFQLERDRWTVERTDLLQRIQAPEQAVIQHQIEHSGAGEQIPPLTDEEAAEMEQNRLLVARMIEEEEALRGALNG